MDPHMKRRLIPSRCPVLSGSVAEMRVEVNGSLMDF